MALGKGAFQRQYKEVELEGRGTARIAQLSQRDYGVVRRTLQKNRPSEDDVDAAEEFGVSVVFPLFISLGLVDDAGERIFDGPDDPEIANLSLTEVCLLGQEISNFWKLDKLNQITPKNSGAVPSDS